MPYKSTCATLSFPRQSEQRDGLFPEERTLSLHIHQWLLFARLCFQCEAFFVCKEGSSSYHGSPCHEFCRVSISRLRLWKGSLSFLAPKIQEAETTIFILVPRVRWARTGRDFSLRDMDQCSSLAPSRLRILEVTQKDEWGRSSFSPRPSTPASKPRTLWCPWCRAPASSSGHQNRAKPWL